MTRVVFPVFATDGLNTRVLHPDVPRAVCPYCKKDMGQPSSFAALCSSLNGHFNHPANSVECRAARLDACERAARYEQ